MLDLRDVPDECGAGAERYLALSIQAIKLHNKPAVYTPAVTPSLKWEPHGIQFCFPLFTTGMDSHTPSQHLLTNSALQVTAEHMPEYNDQ